MEKSNPYHPPETDGRNLSNAVTIQAIPSISRRTLLWLRIVAAWLAILTGVLIFLAVDNEIDFVADFHGVFAGSWENRLGNLLSVAYLAMVVLNSAVALGLALRTSWSRPAGMMLLFLLWSILVGGFDGVLSCIQKRIFTGHGYNDGHSFASRSTTSCRDPQS